MEKLTNVTVIRNDGFREIQGNGRRPFSANIGLKRIKICFMCEIKGFASGVKYADLLLKSLRRELTAASREIAAAVGW